MKKNNKQKFTKVTDYGKKFTNLEEAKDYYQHLCDNRNSYLENALNKMNIKGIKRFLPWIILGASACIAVLPIGLLTMLKSLGVAVAQNPLTYLSLIISIPTGLICGAKCNEIATWLLTGTYRKQFDQELSDLEEYIEKEEAKSIETTKENERYSFIEMTQDVIDVISKLNYEGQKSDLESLYHLQLRFLRFIDANPTMRENDCLRFDPTFLKELVSIEMKLSSLQKEAQRHTVNEEAIREVLIQLQNMNASEDLGGQVQDENPNRPMSM